MRFNTPEEVRAWADRVAAEDKQRSEAYGIDRNPYTTQGGRNDWQRGYDNAPPRSFEGTREFDTYFQRGAAAARLDANQQP